jgi:ribosomal protein L37AE/L43A
MQVHQGTALAQREELTIDDLVAQVAKIQAAMRTVMKDGEHYGVIPGADKPSLLKPGAEKLCLLFRLDPQYDTTESYHGDHLTVVSRCTLYHITSGHRFGSGMGSCSTKESKYAYRHARRRCPTCNKEAIIRGKEEYGGGWLCFKKRDGCGAKFKDGDAAIEGQEVGRVPNEDKADQYNTVLKMANKRSLVAAVLNVTAASDIFTQDLEDHADHAEPAPRPEAAAAPAAAEPTAPDRDILIGRIEAGMDKLQMPAAKRVTLAERICGTADFRRAELSDLQLLLAELVKQHKATSAKS